MSTAANAASISYVLDQSNALPDGTGYLQVTIADGANGAIDFTVQALSPLTSIAGSNFGIQSFAFNVEGSADGASITNLPTGWRVRDDFRMSTFGFFDVKVYGTGANRLSTLTFSVDGVEGDTVDDYAGLSTGGASGGNQIFAAHVAGFSYKCDDKATRNKCVTSGFFGGSTENVVPLPATAWLAVTGFAAALVRARRRRA
jgi:hypothetical protein